MRGRIQYAGPVAVSQLAEDLALEESWVDTSLLALEGQGLVMRGTYLAKGDSQAPLPELNRSGLHLGGPQAGPHSDKTTGNDWCDRRLLARIHRLTLDGLRRRIQPVTATDYLRFLARHQHLSGGLQWTGAIGVARSVGATARL